VGVAGHSAETRTDYLPNTRVVLPSNVAVECLAPLIPIPIPHAQISGRISTVLSCQRFVVLPNAPRQIPGCYRLIRLRSLFSTSFQVVAFSNDPFIRRNVI